MGTSDVRHPLHRPPHAYPRLFDDPVCIVGAGIAGLSSAVALQKVGVPVYVLEAAPHLRTPGAALSLWSNAWKALDQLGVADELRGHYLPLSRVELCRDDGRLLKSFGFDYVEEVEDRECRGVHRLALLRTLEGALAEPVRYNKKVVGIREEADVVVVEVEDQEVGTREEMRCAVLVGSDGIRSQVAQSLGLGPLNYAGYIAYRGVARSSEGLSVPLDTIRQVWGQGVRAGLYPLTSSEYYWFVCANAPQSSWKAQQDGEALKAEALQYVQGWSWGLEAAVEATLPADVSKSRISDRWSKAPLGRGRITLAGDALHPMTPNLGQGGCTALEDAIVLAHLLQQASQKSQLAEVLREYEVQRGRRCLPLTVRSNLMGFALQLPFPPVCFARDLVVSKVFQPDHFFDHTLFSVPALSG